MTSIYKRIQLEIKYPCMKAGLILSAFSGKQNKVQNMDPNIPQGTVKNITAHLQHCTQVKTQKSQKLLLD